MVLASFLAACAGGEEPPQPVSPIVLRTQLAGHTVTGSQHGQTFFLRFARDGVASINGATAEFGRWRIAENGDLCLQWRDRPEACAAVYQTSVMHYRFGDIEINDLGHL